VGLDCAGTLAGGIDRLARSCFTSAKPGGSAAHRVSVQPPDKATSLENPTISPDGRDASLHRLPSRGSASYGFAHSIPFLHAPSPEPEGANYPFWSPDNRFLGFFAQRKLKKVEVSSGAAQALCDSAVPGRGGTWNRDGQIVFGAGNRSPLSKVPRRRRHPDRSHRAGGGEPNPSLAAGSCRTGQHFIYWSGNASDTAQGSFLVASLVSDLHNQASRSRLVPRGSMPLYADGHLLFVHEDGSLAAQGFDTGERVLLREAAPLGANIGIRSDRTRVCRVLRFRQWGLGLSAAERHPDPSGMAGPGRPVVVHFGSGG
jgi:hypothetical protein